MKGRSSLLFAVSFFLVSAAVSVMLFVHADRLHRQARDTDRAALVIQTAIEEFKAGDTAPCTVYYDRNFSVISEPDKDGYRFTMEVSPDGNLYVISLAVDKLTPYSHNGETEVLAFGTSVYKEGAR